VSELAELQYLQAKFAALMSYVLTVRVLEEVLPRGHVLAATTIRRLSREKVLQAVTGMRNRTN
jgi:hypothetical protein